MEYQIPEFLDKYLITVQKPGRYIGGEYNQIKHEWQNDLLKIALVFPDIYDIGFPNLGLAILYDLINKHTNAIVERVFAPWVDMEQLMRSHNVPLFSLENKKPLSEFDLIGFSIPYESLYSNVLNLIDLAGIPLKSSERKDDNPIIIAGGHACFNPEPMSDFIDAFVIGEGEEVILEIIKECDDSLESRPKRQTLLDHLSEIEGIYVPSQFEVKYHPAAGIKSIQNRISKGKKIRKRFVNPLPPPPTRLLVPNIQVVHDRIAVEIMRGCSRGCRFCQAGMITRPVRERPVSEIVASIEKSVSETGFEEVSLLSLSSSDYLQISELIGQIQELSEVNKINLSLPSLRIESFKDEVMKTLQSKRKGNFTLAPESAAESMRSSINKPISETNLLDTARNIINMGWRNLKLYFMIGFPCEELEDVRSIVDLCLAVRNLPKKMNKPPMKLHVSVNIFIPKPHTPFQWAKFADRGKIEEKIEILRQGFKKTGIKLDYPEYDTALFENILSRGDRRLGKAIELAWKNGAKFDAWDEHFDFNTWQSAFQECGIHLDENEYQMFSANSIFPWDHIDSGVKKEFLFSEFQNSHSGLLTEDCRNVCHACGIQSCYQINCGHLRVPKIHEN